VTGNPRSRDSADGPVHVGDALGSVVGRLGMGSGEVLSGLFARWDEIVGPAMAAHVRPVKTQGSTLVVSADHPAWAVQARHLGTTILERVREVVGPDGSPDRIDVRVRP
jgi:hypothetical protein